jgi:hypothetical protein
VESVEERLGQVPRNGPLAEVQKKQILPALAQKCSLHKVKVEGAQESIPPAYTA